jgi:hypothetical protein
MSQAAVGWKYQLPGTRSVMSDVDGPDVFRKKVISLLKSTRSISKLVYRSIFY